VKGKKEKTKKIKRTSDIKLELPPRSESSSTSTSKLESKNSRVDREKEKDKSGGISPRTDTSKSTTTAKNDIKQKKSLKIRNNG